MIDELGSVPSGPRHGRAGLSGAELSKIFVSCCSCGHNRPSPRYHAGYIYIPHSFTVYKQSSSTTPVAPPTHYGSRRLRSDIPPAPRPPNHTPRGVSAALFYCSLPHSGFRSLHPWSCRARHTYVTHRITHRSSISKLEAARARLLSTPNDDGSRY